VGSAVGMLVCAAAALWPWSRRESTWTKDTGHRSAQARHPAGDPARARA
jgi:hypothetical protein